MERPEDFEEREESPAQGHAEPAEAIGDDAGQDPAREDRYVGTDVPQAVADAENEPDV